MASPARWQETRLSRPQVAACIGSLVTGAALAAYGALGSYQSLSATATEKNLPLPHLVPLGFDGGLLGVVVLDLVLTWIGHPIGWLRQLVRLLATSTVVANAVAGWPDPVAVGLHIAAPLMLLAMIESARTVLLRRIGARNGTLRDRIPLARWILAPWRTWLLWRRMVLWEITHYRSPGSRTPCPARHHDSARTPRTTLESGNPNRVGLATGHRKSPGGAHATDPRANRAHQPHDGGRHHRHRGRR